MFNKHIPAEFWRLIKSAHSRQPPKACTRCGYTLTKWLFPADDEDFEWEPPTEAEMKVIQARRERQDKISKLMGEYLLKGYKMLGECCDLCGVGDVIVVALNSVKTTSVCVKMVSFCARRQFYSRTNNRKTTASHVRSWTQMLTKTTLVTTLVLPSHSQTSVLVVASWLKIQNLLSCKHLHPVVI